MPTIQELCQQHTYLTAQEAERIEQLSRHLQLIADVSQADVFIDCPMPDKSSALVVAQAHPTTAPSLYRTSVVGQFAHAANEPAVMFSLASGQAVVGSRGISQEQVSMQQNVTPIKGHGGRTIGALIMEQDISEKVEQERNVERLMETTEQLSETLLAIAMSEGRVQSLMHEGILLFDVSERLTYANSRARELLREMGRPGIAPGDEIPSPFIDRTLWRTVFEPTGMLCREVQFDKLTLEVKAVAIFRGSRKVGGLLLVRDISALKEKEKQLMVKSAVIKEIHHRVKNNLQTVASLLRLQMRRTKHEEVARVYRDSINRIGSIALIHEMLAYGGLDTISFGDVVERIARTIIASSAKPEQLIGFQLSGDGLRLPSDEATTLALVLNEMIQNCVQHAFVRQRTGEIYVSVRAREHTGEVEVVDNGGGFTENEGEGEEGGTHLGLKIAETLIEENLGGHIRVVSSESGTTVRISFPLPMLETKEGDRLGADDGYNR
ncbi:sensor histidine kinase [Cohnella soli]|uniref:histidine kinase n=1 Tax=Cohnella soli TaxID=425005 RepID=A0ABW0HRN0_9BACL